MRSYLRVVGLALIGAGLCLAQSAPANAGCLGFSGTADGFDRETGISRAQLALAEAINEYKKSKKLGSVTVTPMKAKPQPYWRDSVSADLFYKPDVVKSNSGRMLVRISVSAFISESLHWPERGRQVRLEHNRNAGTGRSRSRCRQSPTR